MLLALATTSPALVVDGFLLVGLRSLRARRLHPLPEKRRSVGIPRVPPVVGRTGRHVEALPRLRDRFAPVDAETHQAAHYLEGLFDGRVDVLPDDGPSGPNVSIDGQQLAA